jgi:hypothetical protein
MKGEYSKSLAEAVLKYPVLKRTVNLAKEFDIKIVRHYAKFTKKGKVYQHLFLTKDKETGEELWETNNNLSNMLSGWKMLKKNVKIFSHEKTA